MAVVVAAVVTLSQDFCSSAFDGGSPNLKRKFEIRGEFGLSCNAWESLKLSPKLWESFREAFI